LTNKSAEKVTFVPASYDDDGILPVKKAQHHPKDDLDL
jgi:hypothetical protein